MKKRGSLLLILSLGIFLILATNLISAVEITLSKESYNPEEILQAEITGNFIDNLNANNLLIYKEGVPRSTPVINGLTKQNNIYYFYALLPSQEGNFSLRIENVRYTESGVQKTDPIIKEFKIERTNGSALSINPGFVITDKDFSIRIKAINENQEITAELGDESKNFTLIQDVENTIPFSISSLPLGKNILKLIYSSETTKGFFSSTITQQYYEIPIFVFDTQTINQTINQTSNSSINDTNINNTNSTTNETKIDIENKTEEEIKALHCSDFGQECKTGETCNLKTQPSLDSATCCPGICEKEKSSLGLIIGVLIILAVIGLLGWLYLKAKNKKPPSSDELLKSRSDSFKRRMDNEEVKEVRGRLGNI